MKHIRKFVAAVRGIPLSVQATPGGPFYKYEKQQANKVQTRFTYVQGPMYFLGQQIVRAMQQAGYPAEIYYCYRSPDLQLKLYDQGRKTVGPNPREGKPLGDTVTNARPYQSPHQYFEAVDIVHPSLFWSASDDYWQALQSCARIVAERFGVEFKLGADWGDMAHIELKDWRSFRATIGRKEPDANDLWVRFGEVLPGVVKDYVKRRHGSPEPVKRLLT